MTNKKDSNNIKNKIKIKKNNNIFIYIILIISLLILYSIYIEPYNLIVKEYKVENDIIPKSFDGIKIVQFSDVHYGSTVDKKYLKKVVNLINKQNPDIVIFTGDLLDKRKKVNEKDIEVIKNELSRIKSNLGNYAVSGNHDLEQVDSFNKIIEDNFTLLNNQEKLIYYKESTPISIIGLSDPTKSKVDYECLKNDNPSYRIILAHQPDEYNKIKDNNFNILLSGHSHNGQIRLPLIGVLYTPKGSRTYYDYHYKVDNKEIFISNGIGTSTIKARFNSTPSINLFRFYAQ